MSDALYKRTFQNSFRPIQKTQKGLLNETSKPASKKGKYLVLKNPKNKKITPVSECILCRKKIAMGQMAGIVNKALYRRYCSSLNYYYTRGINKILSNTPCLALLIFKEKFIFDIQEEWLKRAYRSNEIPRKMRMVLRYQEYRVFRPRIHIQSMERTLDRHYSSCIRLKEKELKRQIEKEEAKQKHISSVSDSPSSKKLRLKLQKLRKLEDCNEVLEPLNQKCIENRLLGALDCDVSYQRAILEQKCHSAAMKAVHANLKMVIGKNLSHSEASEMPSTSFSRIGSSKAKNDSISMISHQQLKEKASEILSFDMSRRISCQILFDPDAEVSQSFLDLAPNLIFGEETTREDSGSHKESQSQKKKENQKKSETLFFESHLQTMKEKENNKGKSDQKEFLQSKEDTSKSSEKSLRSLKEFSKNKPQETHKRQPEKEKNSKGNPEAFLGKSQTGRSQESILLRNQEEYRRNLAEIKQNNFIREGAILKSTFREKDTEKQAKEEVPRQLISLKGSFGPGSSNNFAITRKASPGQKEKVQHQKQQEEPTSNFRSSKHFGEIRNESQIGRATTLAKSQSTVQLSNPLVRIPKPIPVLKLKPVEHYHPENAQKLQRNQEQNTSFKREKNQNQASIVKRNSSRERQPKLIELGKTMHFSTFTYSSSNASKKGADLTRIGPTGVLVSSQTLKKAEEILGPLKTGALSALRRTESEFNPPNELQILKTQQVETKKSLEKASEQINSSKPKIIYGSLKITSNGRIGGGGGAGFKALKNSPVRHRHSNTHGNGLVSVQNPQNQQGGSFLKSSVVFHPSPQLHASQSQKDLNKMSFGDAFKKKTFIIVENRSRSTPKSKPEKKH